jgi:hypothetical protein
MVAGPIPLVPDDLHGLYGGDLGRNDTLLAVPAGLRGQVERALERWAWQTVNPFYSLSLLHVRPSNRSVIVRASFYTHVPLGATPCSRGFFVSRLRLRFVPTCFLNDYEAQ